MDSFLLKLRGYSVFLKYTWFACLLIPHLAFAASADLQLRVVGPSGIVVVGDEITFTLTLTNAGPDVATGIMLSNQLSASVSFARAEITNGTFTVSTNAFVYFLNTLPMATEAVVRLTLNAAQARAVASMAIVRSQVSDPVPSNNSSVQFFTILPLSGSDLIVRRMKHTAVSLADGKVLITGGWYGSNAAAVTRTAEVYDPALGTFNFAGRMSTERYDHASTLLPDGTVLVTGGNGATDSTASVEVFDPVARVFRPTNNLALPRSGHTATLLPDGRVLIAGGAGAAATVEFYDYTKGTISGGGNLVAPRSGHLAALLPNGKVLFAGGAGASAPWAEIFDPLTGVSFPRSVAGLCGPPALAFPDGKVLIFGTNAAQIYDAQAGALLPVSPPIQPHFSPRFTLLADHRVLVTDGTFVAAEVLDPVSSLFGRSSPMTSVRSQHTATLLPDGSVLLAGGHDGSKLAPSERYVVAVTPPSADLQVEVQGPSGSVFVGDNVTFTYSLTNAGPDLATGIVLTNMLPSDAIFTAADISAGSFVVSNNTFFYFLESLPIGTSVAVGLTVTPINTHSITNVASATALQPDPSPENNLYRSWHWFIPVLPLQSGPDMLTGRMFHQSTPLADGRVLITGGTTTSFPSGSTKKAEIFDPALETFTSTGDMGNGRYYHAATLLPDGKVLITGGLTNLASTVELFDPATRVFTPTNNLAFPRSSHTATVLPDGRVLVAGGAGAVAAVEYYNIASGTITAGGNLLAPRVNHVAALLQNGTVLFAGGADASAPWAEIFDPQTGVSVPRPVTNVCGVPVLAFPDGKVLIFGSSAPDQPAAQIYDPAADQLRTTSPPRDRRSEACFTLLADNRVLVSGGGNQVGYLQSVEVFDPATGVFAAASPMTRERVWHSAARLPEGHALITGGINYDMLRSSEIYVVRTDADLDGMEDAWELAHGFSPAERDDAIEDADGDTHTNLQEFLAGTDPRDPASIMRIQTVQLDAAKVRVRFNSTRGKRYRLERNTDFASQTWSAVSTNIPGTGAIIQVEDVPPPGAAQNIYRVRLLPY